MKKYIQADFDSLKRDENGNIHVPSGDWTGVDFGGQSKLIFGDGCRLSGWRRLGDDCTLGNDCELGDDCKLGDWCKLGNRCTLGDACRLGNRCTLGEACKLGEACTLGNRCKMECERVKNADFFFVSNIGRGKRTAYAYCNTKTGEIFFRTGCWFGGIDDFVQRVHDVHGGTQHETDYIAFAEFAKARFARYKGKDGSDEREREADAEGDAD